MKKVINTIILIGLSIFIFGCKRTKIDKEDLIGIWRGENQNELPIATAGFNSIKLTFTNDSVEVTTDMNAWGGHVTVKSIGSWTLDKNVLKTKFGDQDEYSECMVTIEGDKVTFKPDLFFRAETVQSSQYKKEM